VDGSDIEREISGVMGINNVHNRILRNSILDTSKG
jgi:hypothetical protein